MDKKIEDLKFEEALALLEESADKLRNGQLSLEESADVYRKSLQYYEKCSQILAETKQKFEIFRPESGVVEEI